MFVFFLEILAFVLNTLTIIYNVYDISFCLDKVNLFNLLFEHFFVIAR